MKNNNKLLYLLVIAVLALVVVVIYQNAATRRGTSLSLPPSGNQAELPKPLSSGATKEQAMAFSDKVLGLAQGADSVVIRDCKAYPQVIEVEEGTNVKIKNSDSKVRQVGIFNQQAPVAAGAEKSVKTPDVESDTITALFCDRVDQDSVIGYIVVNAGE